LMQPKVSIIIPVYNSEKFIEAAIESCLNQTWNNKEIIIIDDGSTDGTKSILDKYLKSGITVINQNNQGACIARNNGILAATGTHIQFLDSDDLLKPDKIKNQAELNYENDIVFCKCLSFYDGEENYSPVYLNIPNELHFFNLFHDYYVFTPSMLIPKILFSKYGVFDSRLKRAQEHDLNLRFSSKRVKYFCNGEFDVFIRHHKSEDRISNQKITGTYTNDFIFFENIEKNIDTYLENKNVDKKLILEKYFRLIVYKAQQFGNNKEFDVLSEYSKYIKKLNQKYLLKSSSFIKYKGSIYNFMLNAIGLKNFETFRYYYKKYF
jgi:glycosyltransferase involved in cell wall biosynthesis